ncbi:MAG: hypothetical protein ACYCSS_04465 [Sulfuriferula sp.]
MLSISTIPLVLISDLTVEVLFVSAEVEVDKGNFHEALANMGIPNLATKKHLSKYVSNSVEYFPDLGWKQRPIVSTPVCNHPVF